MCFMSSLRLAVHIKTLCWEAVQGWSLLACGGKFVYVCVFKMDLATALRVDLRGAARGPAQGRELARAPEV